jgi:PleD family two-component response regulator
MALANMRENGVRSSGTTHCLVYYALSTAPGSGMAVVLVVEDDEQVRVLAEAILVERGHQTLSATTTAEALALIGGDQPIDLLFTDIGLGPDVARPRVGPAGG